VQFQFQVWKAVLAEFISLDSFSLLSCIARIKNSVALVRKGTIPTEQPLLVGEVSANFSG
jgi:hypothetical protein